ncbi:TPD1 protein homolog 1-like [Musa acuminata AAA Group]|uniref:TPD1 protein homolog 1 n=1 Tax=Musa acuminata AAA Group TaxID=214697 RepID=UPI0031DAA2E2
MGWFKRRVPWWLTAALLSVVSLSLSLSSFLHYGARCRVGGAVHFPGSYRMAEPRKLLGIGGGSEEGTRAERMGEEECSKDDILLYQGATAPLPNGIPTYTVQILNACPTRCSVADIHVRCGWFSSARLINPLLFRRLRFDDCLVNDGAALASGESLSFQYANTYRYPLSVSSVACC